MCGDSVRARLVSGKRNPPAVSVKRSSYFRRRPPRSGFVHRVHARGAIELMRGRHKNRSNRAEFAKLEFTVSEAGRYFSLAAAKTGVSIKNGRRGGWGRTTRKSGILCDAF